jgi:hypothetical protein
MNFFKLTATAVIVGSVLFVTADGLAAPPASAPAQRAITTFSEDLRFAEPLARAVTGGALKGGFALPADTAPPLSRELVYAVGSTLYGGWEYMTTIGQTATAGQHGGAQLRVVVQEIGYGGTPFAYMAGNFLPASANYENDPICIVGNYYTTPCPAGYLVVGFYRYFDLDGYGTPGEFTYQNTSIVSPFNTLSTQIDIL